MSVTTIFGSVSNMQTHTHTLSLYCQCKNESSAICVCVYPLSQCVIYFFSKTKHMTVAVFEHFEQCCCLTLLPKHLESEPRNLPQATEPLLESNCSVS